VFEFGTSDRAICGTQMGEHGSNGYVSEAKNVIIENCKVDAIDCSKNLFLISSWTMVVVASSLSVTS